MKTGKVLWIFAAVTAAACGLDEEGLGLFPPGDGGHDVQEDIHVDPWPDTGIDVDAEASADVVEDADVEDVTSDVPEDVVPDIVQDVVQDVQQDAPVDVQQDAPADTGTPTCLTKGIRVRWKPPPASINSPIVQANGAISNPNAFGTMCTAADDKDPDPKVFDCCFSTAAAPKNTNVYFDFVLQDTTHDCGVTGCQLPFSQYAVWADGALLTDYAVTFLPSCQIVGTCPYVLQATIPP